MRPEAARADRRGELRAAARAWRKAGAIDDTTLTAIEAATPDDRVRVGPVFRVLLFLFTVLAAVAALGFVWYLVEGSVGYEYEEPVLRAIMLAFGIALAALTEVQIGRLKRMQGGTEAGTSFAALVFLIVGAGWFMVDALPWSDLAEAPLVYAIAAALLGVAAWRWGYALYAGAAAAALFLALASAPGARLLWIVLPLAATPFLVRLGDSARLPPALRQGAAAALAVGLIALYVAIHLGSFDAGAIERIPRLLAFDAAGPEALPRSLRWLSIVATAVMPVALLALGIHTRRRLFLLLGLGTGAASAITLGSYVHLGPRWAVLTAAGAALVAAVVALRRYLDSGPENERGGFTAEPLFADLERQRLLEAGAVAVALVPEARPIQEEAKFEGRGGDFGGGGASSGF